MSELEESQEASQIVAKVEKKNPKVLKKRPSLSSAVVLEDKR